MPLIDLTSDDEETSISNAAGNTSITSNVNYDIQDWFENQYSEWILESEPEDSIGSDVEFESVQAEEDVLDVSESSSVTERRLSSSSNDSSDYRTPHRPNKRRYYGPTPSTQAPGTSSSQRFS
jgi:hypothetical protein